MARSLTAGMVTEVTVARLNPVIFLQLDFDAGTLRLWTGYGAISWNGSSWTGAGSLLAASAIEETSELRATGVTLSLSGLDTSIIDLAQGEPYQGRRAQLWLGCLTDAGAVVADPYRLLSGRMDVMEIADAGETCTISLSVESDLAVLDTAAARRYTTEDQKIDFAPSGSPEIYDKGFDMVPALQQLEILNR